MTVCMLDSQLNWLQVVDGIWNVMLLICSNLLNCTLSVCWLCCSICQLNVMLWISWTNWIVG